MAKDTQLTNLAVNTEAAAMGSLLDGGFIDIYGGDKPTTGDTPIGDQPLAVTLQYGTPAFAAPIGGVLTANPLTPGVAVANVNPVGWARCYQSDHVTPVKDVSVGTENANVILPTTNIAAGVTVGASSYQHVIPKSAPNT